MPTLEIGIASTRHDALVLVLSFPWVWLNVPAVAHVAL